MNKLNDAADSQDLDPVSLPPNKDILRNPEQYKPKRKQMKFTPKQEKIIQLYVYHDLTNVECAHRAGYAFPAPEATKMLNDPRYVHIQNKILELRELEQKKYEITFEKVARDLHKIRDAAMENGTYGAAVQAELGRAKLAGLLVDKKEIKHGRIDQMDRAEVEARLQKLLEKNELAPITPPRIESTEILQEEDEVDPLDDVTYGEETAEIEREGLQMEDYEVIEDEDEDEGENENPPQKEGE